MIKSHANIGTQLVMGNLNVLKSQETSRRMAVNPMVRTTAPILSLAVLTTFPGTPVSHRSQIRSIKTIRISARTSVAHLSTFHLLQQLQYMVRSLVSRLNPLPPVLPSLPLAPEIKVAVLVYQTITAIALLFPCRMARMVEMIISRMAILTTRTLLQHRPGTILRAELEAEVVVKVKVRAEAAVETVEDGVVEVREAVVVALGMRQIRP